MSVSTDAAWTILQVAVLNPPKPVRDPSIEGVTPLMVARVAFSCGPFIICGVGLWRHAEGHWTLHFPNDRGRDRRVTVTSRGQLNAMIEAAQAVYSALAPASSPPATATLVRSGDHEPQRSFDPQRRDPRGLRALLEKHPSGLPEDAQQRANELEAEAARLTDMERRIAALDDLDRAAATRPLDGTLNGGGREQRGDVKVFADTAARLPEGFDGQVWRSTDGSLIPVLEQRHSLRSFLPKETAAAELGMGGWLRALKFGPKNDLERRVLAEGSIGAGGAMVPTPLSAELIDLLRPKVVSYQAGARTIPMTSQTLRFAAETADPTGAWRAENASIATSVPTFANLTLTAQSWAVIVQASRELLEDATNVSSALMNIFARAAAVALDQAILVGTGHSNHQPIGIEGTSGIQAVSMGANGAAIADWSNVLDAVGALEAANAGIVTAMVMAPRTARVLYGLVDTLGQPLRRVDRIANVPMLVTTSMPITETQGTASDASSILLGNFGSVFVGMRTELAITVLDQLYAANGQVGFCLWLRADVAISRPAEMAQILGIIPA